MSVGSVKDATRLMARYNLWANEQFAVYFCGSAASIIKTPVSGSFSSIEKTLLHVWDAQQVWYLRLHGENPTAFASDNWSGSPDQLFEKLLTSAKQFVALEEQYTPDDMYKVFDYRTFAGGPQSSRRYEVLLHVFNHSMYHRGQCITMARLLGQEKVPSTDLIRFLRLQ